MELPDVPNPLFPGIRDINLYSYSMEEMTPTGLYVVLPYLDRWHYPRGKLPYHEWKKRNYYTSFYWIVKGYKGEQKAKIRQSSWGRNHHNRWYCKDCYKHHAPSYIAPYVVSAFVQMQCHPTFQPPAFPSKAYPLPAGPCNLL